MPDYPVVGQKDYSPWTLSRRPASTYDQVEPESDTPVPEIMRMTTSGGSLV